MRKAFPLRQLILSSPRRSHIAPLAFGSTTIALNSFSTSTPAFTPRPTTSSKMAKQTQEQHEHVLALVRRMIPPLSPELHKGQAGELPLRLPRLFPLPPSLPPLRPPLDTHFPPIPPFASPYEHSLPPLWRAHLSSTTMPDLADARPYRRARRFGRLLGRTILRGDGCDAVRRGSRARHLRA